MGDVTTARQAALDALPEPQRAELAALDEAIRAAAPTLCPRVTGGAFAYGSYRYRYATGRAGEWHPLSLVGRRHGLSLYVGAAAVERWADRLPNASCGKGCIRVRRASDIPADVLREIVEHAVSIDGRLLDWTGRDQAGDPAIT
jgi:Domain of unknown function (DU1801)